MPTGGDNKVNEAGLACGANDLEISSPKEGRLFLAQLSFMVMWACELNVVKS